MKSLNSKLAENFAEEFINIRYKPLESDGHFSWYVVRVGEDETHQPESIYVDSLPVSESIIDSIKTAINIFKEKCDPYKEFLVKVSVIDDGKNKKLLSKILHQP